MRVIVLLGRALSDDLPDVPLLQDRLQGLVERVVADLPADVELLTAVSDTAPYDGASIAVTRRVLDVLPDRPTSSPIWSCRATGRAVRP